MGLSYDIKRLEEIEKLDNINPDDRDAPKTNTKIFRGGYFIPKPGVTLGTGFGLTRLPMDIMTFAPGRVVGALRIPEFVRIEPTDYQPLEEMWPVGWKELHLRGRQGYLPRILPEVGELAHGFWWDEAYPECFLRGYGRVVSVVNMSFNIVASV